MSSEGRGSPTIPGLDQRLFESAMAFVRQNNAIRIGKITKVDYKAGKAQVTFLGEPGGDNIITSHWLPWSVPRARTNRSWIPLDKDEQVIVVCPHGNINAGVITGSVNYDKYPHEASDGDRELGVYGSKAEAFYEVNRKDWVWRHYLNDAGTFRFEVGPPQSISEGSSLILDKDHIQLRVGTTTITLRDGIIRLQVTDGAAEIELSLDRIAALVGGNTSMLLTKEAISLELVAEQVRLAMEKDSLKTLVKQSLLELKKESAVLATPGTKLTFLATGAKLESLKFDGVQLSATASAYAAGPTIVIPAEITKPAPDLAVGHAPTTPDAP